MFEIIETVINEGNFVLKEMLSRIDFFFAKGELTEEEYNSLKEKARTKATPNKETDLFAKLKELEARVKALEEKIASNDEQGEATVEEFVSAKWYYNGNKCLWEGKVYTCIAPEGTVCVWSPTDYPAYWSAEAEESEV